jgi:acyl carrier protein
MNNEEKLKRILMSVFRLNLESVPDDIAYGQCPQWDSLSHLTLILTLEEEFGISIPDEEVQHLISFSLIKEWLESNE